MKNNILKKMLLIQQYFKKKTTHMNLSINIINKLQSQYIGKKSFFLYILKKIHLWICCHKKKIGFIANQVFMFIKNFIKKFKSISKTNKISNKNNDLFILNKKNSINHFSLITLMQSKIIKCLNKLNFYNATGPEVDHVFYNFDKLNIQHGHSSRNASDTFYIKNNIVLRTHTSPIQIRILSSLIKTNVMPIRIFSSGKVYRKDLDNTHSPMFHQLECIYVDKIVSILDLKNTILNFICSVFEKNIKIRWRASFFPFTEPSYEIDMECFKCKSKGCVLCKYSGWIEVMGAGLINSLILKNTQIDVSKYTGFAFGIGIERFAMIYYEQNEIRKFFGNITI